jgi:hypothetical protein
MNTLSMFKTFPEGNLFREEKLRFGHTPTLGTPAWRSKRLLKNNVSKLAPRISTVKSLLMLHCTHTYYYHCVCTMWGKNIVLCQYLLSAGFFLKCMLTTRHEAMMQQALVHPRVPYASICFSECLADTNIIKLLSSELYYLVHVLGCS